ncbi:MAG: hypothetical protein M0R76_02785 [Proteobacteria bacterium]|nr:hypothetical protein [Pseudomonadota bacterium]
MNRVLPVLLLFLLTWSAALHAVAHVPSSAPHLRASAPANAPAAHGAPSAPHHSDHAHHSHHHSGICTCFVSHAMALPPAQDWRIPPLDAAPHWPASSRLHPKEVHTRIFHPPRA